MDFGLIGDFFNTLCGIALLIFIFVIFTSGLKEILDLFFK